MIFKYLHKTSAGIFYLDHRLTPEVRAMFASMASRLPSGGIEARYSQITDEVAAEFWPGSKPLPYMRDYKWAEAKTEEDDLNIVAQAQYIRGKSEARLCEYPLHPRVQHFFDEFVGKYGHSSIQEQTGEPAVYLEDCSWFTNWLLFDSPLVAGQEFSTRAVRRADWPMARECIGGADPDRFDLGMGSDRRPHPGLEYLHHEWMRVFEAEVAWWVGEFKSSCSSCEYLPPCVLDTFRCNPLTTSIKWDGEVSIDGGVTGDPSIFEPLWDGLVDTPHCVFHRCAACGGTGRKYPTADKEPFRPALDRARWALPGTISTGACYTSNVRERSRTIRDASLVGGDQSVWGDLTEAYKQALPGISVHAFKPVPPSHQVPWHLQAIFQPVERLNTPGGVGIRIFNNKGSCRNSAPYTRPRKRVYADPWTNRDTRVEVVINCSIATARDWHRHRTLYPWHMALVKDNDGKIVLSSDYEMKSDYARSKCDSLISRSSSLHSDFMKSGDVQRAALCLPFGTMVQLSGSGGYRDVLYTMELRAYAHGANFEYKRQAEACLGLMNE